MVHEDALEILVVLRAATGRIAGLGKSTVVNKLTTGRALAGDYVVDEGVAFVEVGLIAGCIGQTAETAEKDTLVVGEYAGGKNQPI